MESEKGGPTEVSAIIPLPTIKIFIHFTLFLLIRLSILVNSTSRYQIKEVIQCVSERSVCVCVHVYCVVHNFSHIK